MIIEADALIRCEISCSYCIISIQYVMLVTAHYSHAAYLMSRLPFHKVINIRLLTFHVSTVLHES